MRHLSARQWQVGGCARLPIPRGPAMRHGHVTRSVSMGDDDIMRSADAEAQKRRRRDVMRWGTQ